MCDLDGAKTSLEALLDEVRDLKAIVKYYADMDLWDKDEYGYWVHARGPHKALEALAGKDGG